MADAAADDDRAAPGGLFAGKTIWVAQRVPQRSVYTQRIRDNGGMITILDKQAHVLIADHLRRTLAPPGSTSYEWIDACIAEGRLLDRSEYPAGPVEKDYVRPAGSARPIRGGRVPFTEEDDHLLWQWVADAEKRGGSLRGNDIYKELERANNRHTFQSWRDRYIKYLSKRPRPDIVTIEARPQQTNGIVQSEPQETTTTDRGKEVEIGPQRRGPTILSSPAADLSRARKNNPYPWSRSTPSPAPPGTKSSALPIVVESRELTPEISTAPAETARQESVGRARTSIESASQPIISTRASTSLQRRRTTDQVESPQSPAAAFERESLKQGGDEPGTPATSNQHESRDVPGGHPPEPIADSSSAVDKFGTPDIFEAANKAYLASAATETETLNELDSSHDEPATRPSGTQASSINISSEQRLSNKPVVKVLAQKARLDPDLKALMDIISKSRANADQIDRFRGEVKDAEAFLARRLSRSLSEEVVKDRIDRDTALGEQASGGAIFTEEQHDFLKAEAYNLIGMDSQDLADAWDQFAEAWPEHSAQEWREFWERTVGPKMQRVFDRVGQLDLNRSLPASRRVSAQIRANITPDRARGTPATAQQSPGLVLDAASAQLAISTPSKKVHFSSTTAEREAQLQELLSRPPAESRMSLEVVSEPRAVSEKTVPAKRKHHDDQEITPERVRSRKRYGIPVLDLADTDDYTLDQESRSPESQEFAIFQDDGHVEEEKENARMPDDMSQETEVRPEERLSVFGDEQVDFGLVPAASVEERGDRDTTAAGPSSVTQGSSSRLDSERSMYHRSSARPVSHSGASTDGNETFVDAPQRQSDLDIDDSTNAPFETATSNFAQVVPKTLQGASKSAALPMDLDLPAPQDEASFADVSESESEIDNLNSQAPLEPARYENEVVSHENTSASNEDIMNLPISLLESKKEDNDVYTPSSDSEDQDVSSSTPQAIEDDELSAVQSASHSEEEVPPSDSGDEFRERESYSQRNVRESTGGEELVERVPIAEESALEELVGKEQPISEPAEVELAEEESDTSIPAGQALSTRQSDGGLPSQTNSIIETPAELLFHGDFLTVPTPSPEAAQSQDLLSRPEVALKDMSNIHSSPRSATRADRRSRLEEDIAALAAELDIPSPSPEADAHADESIPAFEDYEELPDQVQHIQHGSSPRVPVGLGSKMQESLRSSPVRKDWLFVSADSDDDESMMQSVRTRHQPNDRSFVKPAPINLKRSHETQGTPPPPTPIAQGNGAQDISSPLRPTSKGSQSSSGPDPLLQRWFESELQVSGDSELVFKAAEMANCDMRIASELLRLWRLGRPTPASMPGVWTAEHDNALMQNQMTDIDRLSRLHGKSRLAERRRHISTKITDNDDHLSAELLRMWSDGQPTPRDMAGVWLPEHDTVMITGDSLRVRELFTLHGVERCESERERLAGEGRL